MSKLARRHLALLHTVPRSLGIDEPTRKLIQRNVGGAWSAASLGFAGFAAVMAYYEGLGWRDERWPAGHWRRLADRGDLLAAECKLLKMAEMVGWTRPDGSADFSRLDGFAERMSQGRVRSFRQADARELYVMIEALKRIAERAAAGEKSA